MEFRGCKGAPDSGRSQEPLDNAGPRDRDLRMADAEGQPDRAQNMILVNLGITEVITRIIRLRKTDSPLLKKVEPI